MKTILWNHLQHQNPKQTCSPLALTDGRAGEGATATDRREPEAERARFERERDVALTLRAPRDTICIFSCVREDTFEEDMMAVHATKPFGLGTVDALIRFNASDDLGHCEEALRVLVNAPRGIHNVALVVLPNRLKGQDLARRRARSEARTTARRRRLTEPINPGCAFSSADSSTSSG